MTVNETLFADKQKHETELGTLERIPFGIGSGFCLCRYISSQAERRLKTQMQHTRGCHVLSQEGMGSRQGQ
jgi:hypothetical protein